MSVGVAKGVMCHQKYVVLKVGRKRKEDEGKTMDCIWDCIQE